MQHNLDSERPQPLQGVIVADFSRVLAGPSASMLLADLGADVIKVERPGTGDDTRTWGPPYRGQTSTYFLGTNRGKRSIALDLKDPADQEVARQLAVEADVLIENFLPGTLDRSGLGYDQLRDHNPGLVYCSVTGFGSAAGARRPGYDFIAQAAGGLMSITGEEGGEPMKVGVALVDVITGLHATIAILAALRGRETTGLGHHIEVNLLSSILSAMSNQSSAFVAAGVVPSRLGNRHPSVAPYQLIRTADRSVAIGCGNNQQFRALCHALNAPALADEPRFASNRDRVENLPALQKELSLVAASVASEDVLAQLEAAGVPCAPVNTIEEAFALAEQLGLEPIQHLDTGTDALPQVSPPFRFDGRAVPVRGAPPGLGEQGEEIRAWLATATARRGADALEAGTDDVADRGNS